VRKRRPNDTGAAVYHERKIASQNECTRVLAVIDGSPGTGCTIKEIAVATGIPRPHRQRAHRQSTRRRRHRRSAAPPEVPGQRVHEKDLGSRSTVRTDVSEARENRMTTLNYQNATSPDVEAAVPVLPSSSADSLPAGPLRTFLLTWRRSLTAAGDCLHSLRDVATQCRAAVLATIREEIELSISQRRRGYVKGLRCAVCHEAVHDDQEMCPKLWAGLCAICGPVLLDYYGHGLARDCDPRRGHTISRRHKATASEWRRSRFAVLKPSPIQPKERTTP
jgi:hypothetical protein